MLYAILIRWRKDDNVINLRQIDDDGDVVLSQQCPASVAMSAFSVANWHGGSLQIQVRRQWDTKGANVFAVALLDRLGRVKVLNERAVDSAITEACALCGVDSAEIGFQEWSSEDLYPSLATHEL